MSVAFMQVELSVLLALSALHSERDKV